MMPEIPQIGGSTHEKREERCIPPDGNAIDKSRKLPVLIYFHGGGFRCGSQGPPEAAVKFMEEDVVLVTVHYRLGPFGFLSTEDDEVPGNYGFKDQALAIKWIYENIDDYSGDESSLIAFGFSAGGASSNYLIKSPLSRDYLRGAIAESGVIDSVWALAWPGRARKYAKKLGELVGCTIGDNFLECLQKVDANLLISSGEKEFTVWDFDPGVIYQPVIEVKNDGAFMTEDPRNIEVNKILISGINEGEGLIKSAALKVDDGSLLNGFVNNIDKCMEAILLIARDSHPRATEFIDSIKAKYFPNLSNKQDIIQGLENLFRDYHYLYPLYLALERHTGPAYAYVYHHRSEETYVDILVGENKLKTEVPCHGDETLMLFNYSSLFSNTKGRIEDKKVSERLIKMWINVSKHQNPTPEGSPVVWQKYSNGNVLHIKTLNDSMGPLGMEEIIDYWSNTFKIIS